MGSRGYNATMRLAILLLALSLSGCFPLPLGCRTSWFNRCSPMPEGTTESCAKQVLMVVSNDPNWPYWSEGVDEATWEATVKECQKLMQKGASATEAAAQIKG